MSVSVSETDRDVGNIPQPSEEHVEGDQVEMHESGLVLAGSFRDGDGDHGI